jgi:predicted transcriptional regulator of viral defense system
MESTSVSKREAELIDAVNEKEMIFFEPRDVRRFLGITPRNAYQILRRMKQKGLVVHVERGKYMLRERWEETDIRALASNLVTPSYLGFWSALHFHHMTEQVPRIVFVVTTRRTDDREIRGNDIRFVTVREELMFGYERLGDTVVSTPEKTVVDCLLFPQHASVSVVNDALSQGKLDADTLVDYCLRVGSSALAARLGYLLESNGMLESTDELKELVTSYTKLDPSGDERNPNSGWKLYVNVDL